MVRLRSREKAGQESATLTPCRGVASFPLRLISSASHAQSECAEAAPFFPLAKSSASTSASSAASSAASFPLYFSRSPLLPSFLVFSPQVAWKRVEENEIDAIRSRRTSVAKMERGRIHSSEKSGREMAQKNFFCQFVWRFLSVRRIFSCSPDWERGGKVLIAPTAENNFVLRRRRREAAEKREKKLLLFFQLFVSITSFRRSINRGLMGGSRPDGANKKKR